MSIAQLWRLRLDDASSAPTVADESSTSSADPAVSPAFHRIPRLRIYGVVFGWSGKRRIDRTGQSSTAWSISGRTPWWSPIDRRSCTHVSIFVHFQHALSDRSSLIEWKAGLPVVFLSPQVATFFRPHQPRQSPLYRLIERYYPDFERTYGECD